MLYVLVEVEDVAHPQVLERRRRDSLQRSTEKRALRREVDRRHKRGSMRFVLLVLALIATAVIVTVVMFRVLYLLLG